ncbi:MAG: glycoside hydrolase family 32 protein [Armatimonas sp.]
MILGLLLLALLSASKPTGTTTDLVLGDFEGSSYSPWKAEGTAFAKGPATGKLLPQLEIQGARGNGAASSEIEGDRPTGTLTSPSFTIQRRFLTFVIGGGNYQAGTCLNLLIDGKVVRSATGRNSDVLLPVSWDLQKWRGKSASLQIVDRATGDWGHINVDQIVQTDTPETQPVTVQPLYQETHRPQFHFSARQWTITKLNPQAKEEGWMNDMNGLIYYDGEWHFFAQRWWKCWIHAVSKDLVHWTELGVAFGEEQHETGSQSGTTVIDYENTSGLSPDKKNPPMVAFWTRNDNKNHCITYSLDKGRTWKYYAKNPYLVFPERDPKVFWYAPGKHWVMVMYGDSQYHIFTSKNLLDWKNEHHPIPNSYECPDFFELAIDGDPSKKKWVLMQGDGKYSIGTFNGTEFKEEMGRFSCDVGPNFYATQTWANTETGDGRRIQAAWMRGGAYPDMPFNQQASFPCELTLRTTPAGPRIFREPVHEIAVLHGKETTWANRAVTESTPLTLAPSGDLYHLKMNVDIPEGSTLTLNIRGVPLVLTHNTLACGTDPQTLHGTLKSIEVLIDRTSIEVFANGGEVSLSRCYLPGGDGLTLKTTGGAATLKSASLFPLQSIWPKTAP